MRANSSIPGLVVVVLAMLTACKPAEDSVDVISPVTLEPIEPVPELAPPLTLPPTPAELDELLRNVEPVRSARSTSESQATIDTIREPPQPGTATDRAAPPGAIPPPPRHKLLFECTDDVMFAVRTVGSALEVYPPGSPDNYVVLLHQPSEPGTYHYIANRAEFRFNGELATLVLGRDRWADCVSNPAAAVWQEPPRRAR